MKPRLLDLFCGAGGAGMGYSRVGFDVTGVDHVPQPNYPFRFVQADAMRYLAERGAEFDVIHASPPCQAYCAPTQYNGNRHTYPDHIPLLRAILELVGVPYVIENTPGAPLKDPIVLCGTMFGLRVYRHRLFECSEWIETPAHPRHNSRCARNGVIPPADGFFTVTGGKHSNAWRVAAAEAMGVPWTRTVREVCEAIPPAYTEYVGAKMLARLLRLETQAVA